jgi:FlgD Ig-like domain/HYR domain
MRKVVFVGLLAISALLRSSPLHALPAHDWSHRYGGPNSNIGYDVAVDGSGNVVITGTFAGTMDFGGGPLTSAGSWDIFLAKFDATGAHLWSQRFGAVGNDGGTAVTVDAAGNITMTGYFLPPVSLGGATLPGHGGRDIFVAKFDGAGLHQWSHEYGSGGDDAGQDVVADALGNVIVTGHYGGAINFGGAGTPAFGSRDFFVLKLDPTGAYKWSKGIGSLGIDAGYGVAVDASNSVLLTGTFNRTVNFGGGPIASTGSGDVFVVKYDQNGAHQWSTRFGGSSDDSGEGIGVDASSSVVVTGMYNDAFLVKYDTNGVQQWTQSFVSSNILQSMDLDIGPAGTIAITGNFRGSTDLGGGPLTSAGDYDIYLAVYDENGSHRWSQRFGNTGADWGYGGAFDPSGNLIAAGSFLVSVDFGGGPLVSAGLADVYLVKFADDVADTTPPLITCPGDITVEPATPDGTPATDPAIAAFLAGATASDDVDPAPGITHDAPAIFPVGTTTVTFRAMDATGNHAECSAAVTVVDATPPQITVVLDKDVLWPPNHKFVTVCAQVSVSDNGSAEPTFTLVSITSSESTDGKRAAQTASDINGALIGTPDLCFDLRAERAGHSDGRVYEIVYAAQDASGNVAYATVQVWVPHDMSGHASEVQSTALTSIHPNPFNPQTTIEYTMSSRAPVSIEIFDASGKLVRRLDEGVREAGSYRVEWDGRDAANRPVSSGVYFCRLAGVKNAAARKMVMLK